MQIKSGLFLTNELSRLESQHFYEFYFLIHMSVGTPEQNFLKIAVRNFFFFFDVQLFICSICGQ